MGLRNFRVFSRGIRYLIESIICLRIRIRGSIMSSFELIRFRGRLTRKLVRVFSLRIRVLGLGRGITRLRICYPRKCSKTRGLLINWKRRILRLMRRSSCRRRERLERNWFNELLL